MNQEFYLGMILGAFIGAAIIGLLWDYEEKRACDVPAETAAQLDKLNFGDWRALKSQYKYLDFDCQQKIRTFAFSISPECSRRVLNICSGSVKDV